MLPFVRFTNALAGYKAEFDENFDELIRAAELISKKSNVIEREDNGQFYVQAQGTLEEITNTLKVMINKLEKIKQQRV